MIKVRDMKRDDAVKMKIAINDTRRDKGYSCH